MVSGSSGAWPDRSTTPGVFSLSQACQTSSGGAWGTRAASARRLGRSRSCITPLVLEEKQKLTKAKVNAKKAQGREDLIDEFRFWWDKARCYVVDGWDPTVFQREVTEAHCRETDRKFLDDIVKLSRAAVSPVRLFDSSELRTLVKHREAKVRRQKCRLCGRPEHRRYLQQWEAPPKRRQSAFQLSFRHNTGDTIVRDLLRKPHRRSADVQD